MAKKTHRKNHRLNTIQLPLHVQRTIILDSDPTYAANVRTLLQRTQAGLVPLSLSNAITGSLQMAALRRAGVSLKHSRQLMAA